MLFKTDGIRKNGNELIALFIPFKLGKVLSLRGNKFVLGKDTRLSSNALYEQMLISLLTSGKEVIALDVAPTSMVGYVSKIHRCDYGIMISASHNSYEDNGIKVFSRFGEKISLDEALVLEQEMNNLHAYPYSEFGRIIEGTPYKQEFISYLRNQIEKNDDKMWILSPSNGVYSSYLDEIFHDKIRYRIIDHHPNGKNINQVSSYHLNTDENLVIFDGDGDRIKIITPLGELKGDDLLFILGKAKGVKNLVTTKMSSLTLEEHFALSYTQVGDSEVYQTMKEKGILLGGEASGHLLFLDSLLTSDGVYSFIEFLKANSLTSFKRLYELSYNLPLESLKETNLNVFQEKLKSLLAEKYYLIRCSGTENVLRIFIQLESLTLKEEIEKMIKELQ